VNTALTATGNTDLSSRKSVLYIFRVRVM